MADGVAVTAGAGTLIATDDLTGDGSIGGHVQLMKLVDGADGGNNRASVGSATKGLAVEPRAKLTRIVVTPVIDTAVYAAKDNVGGLLTFTDAVRSAGATGTILSAVLVDKDQERVGLDLVLFRAAITAPTNNAVFAPTDTELLDCVGHVPFYTADYADFSTNSVATKPNLSIPFDCTGTSLYGALVARGTPTYTSTSDLQVALTILQD